MNKLIRNIIAAAAVISTAAFAASSTQAEELTKAQVEQIVHDYILNNPDVLIEAAGKIQARQKEIQKGQIQDLSKKIIDNKAIPQFGASNPKHTIIEFFDYNCGYCKRARPITASVLDEHKDVRYYYMEFPILSDISETAAEIGIAIYATDPTKYKAYNDELMSRTDHLKNEIELQALVEKLGFKWADIKQLSVSDSVKDVLTEIKDIATEMGVSGTPCFIIDGKIYPGAPTSKSAIINMFKN